MKISMLRPTAFQGKAGVFARTLCVGAFAVGLVGAAQAQNVTVNPGAGSYPTLKDAVDAINSGAHTGAITVSVVGDTTETASSVLNESGIGGALYTSILITPSGARSVSGAISAGSPLLDLNGADGITINGLNTGGNSLTIANTTASTIAGTSTIRFINDATDNTIQNATINGAGTAAVTGTVLFGAALTTGNDGNTITGCSIGPAGVTTPTVGINSIGSTASQATRNSGNQATNNNIFDFYNAGGVVSDGILLTGSTDWTITGNSFYQTASRAMAAGSGFIGVSIADTVGGNFNVSNNIVGGSAASAGGTAWTQTGATTHTFIGIRLSVAAAAPSSVQGNIIQNIAVTTASTSSVNSGISAVSGSVNIGTIAGNTIGSSASTGSITWTGSAGSTLTGILAGTGSAGVMAISNNTVGGITIAGAGAIIFRAINTQLGATSYLVSGNTIGSANIANSITSSANALVAGIASSSTSASVTISNNLIANLTSTGILTGNPMVGIITSSTGVNTISGNTIRNFTTSGASTNATSAPAFGGIIISSTTAGQIISQNTIHSANNSAATANVTLTGIYWGNSNNTVAANIVERNLIHSLATTSTGAAILNGIYTFNGSATYRNNMIRLGINAAGADLTSAAMIINGVQSDTLASSTNNWYFNSIYLGGNGVGPGAATTSGFKRLTSDVTDFRNNIVVNDRSNASGTGKHYIMNLNATTGVTSTSNNFLHTGVGSVFGVVAGVDAVSFAAWQSATGLDVASFFSDPKFLNAVGSAATVDLHINPAATTLIEGNGSAVAAPTDDFDGQVRASLTPVDIGADAGNFMGMDLTGPAITYTAPGNTVATGNRVLSVNITDLSGIASGANAPRIYFRKNAGSYVSTQCTGSAPSYSCTIDAAAMGGIIIGDVIGYFVVAQDTAGNVSGNPSVGLVATDVNTVTTPPTTPNSYVISAPFSGNKTVCASGCDYTTLTGAGGVFSAINAGVAIGNIDVQIAGDLIVGEDGSNRLNALVEQPASSNFTVKIYPTGSARAIIGAATAPLIRLNGASRVTIDGSIGGSGTDRSLTIQNTSVTTPSVILIGSVGTTPITNVTLKNSIIINGATTSSAVVISDATISGNAGLFSNITIQNNDVQKALIGVFAQGGTTPQGGSNVVYTQNTLNTVGANAIRLVGLYMQGVDGATISQNTIGNFSAVEGENDTGIWLATGTANATVSGNTVSNLGMTLTTAFAPIGIRESSGVAPAGINFTGNSVSNLTTTGSATIRGIAASSSGVTIQRNNVQGVVNNSTGTYAAFGIDITGGNDDIIQNNFVSDISHNMSGGGAFDTSFSVIGIRLGAGTGHKVYFNSVNLTGLKPGTAASSLLNAAFAIVANTQTGIDVRNNIFANSVTGGTTSLARVSVFLPSGGTSAMNLTWNNNAYYYGADPLTQGIAQIGTTAGTGFLTTLPALAAYTSTLSAAGTNDNASLAATTAVPFLSASDLHIGAGTSVENAGTPIAGVTIDIDGDPRTAPAPEIGADELVDPNTAPSITPAVGVTRQQGTGVSNSTIATVSDAEQTVGSLIVTAPSVPAGLALSSILNTTGTVTADLVAACNATVGANTVGLSVSDGFLSTAGNLIVNVTANSAPVLGSYSATVLIAGNGTTVTSTAPTDNGPVVSLTATAPGFTGSFSGNIADGSITISNAGPASVTPYVVTVTATDNCGLTNTTTFNLTVNAPNTAPSITPAVGVTRQAGSAVSNSTIATVSDAEQSAGSLIVTAPTVPAGLTVSGILNTAGSVSADVVAACSATLGANTVDLSVSDGLLSTAGSLSVDVTADSAPVLGTYSATSVTTGGTNTATPSAAPSDNGIVVSITASAPGFAGVLTGNPSTGVITIASAGPSGSYVVTVTATDNCGITTTTTFTLNVSNANSAPTITPSVGVTRQQGSVASSSNLAVVTDAESSAASLVVTATTVPAGLTVNSILNTNGTVTGSVAAACSATLGANTVVLNVSDGSLNTDGNLSINVTANSAPALGTYAATTVANAGSATVTPSAAPTDNGSVATLTASAPGFTGTLTGNPATGVINISGAAPASPTAYVVTVTATDNCGLVTTATFNLTVSNTANLDVTKDDGVSTYKAGDLLVYTIVLRNLGPDSANGAVFTDIVPATLTNATWTCVAANGAACPQTGGNGSINATVAVLPATGRLTYTLQANVATPMPAQVSNTAQVSIAGLTIIDPQLGNNSATDTNLPEAIFSNGFEDPIVLPIDKANGQQSISLSNLSQLLDETARVVFSADDANGEAIRVYGRRNDNGVIELALAVRNTDGLLRLGAWQTFTGNVATIRYSALSGANGFVLQSARFE